VTASFLVRWPPALRAASISLSSNARLVGMCEVLHINMCKNNSDGCCLCRFGSYQGTASSRAVSGFRMDSGFSRWGFCGVGDAQPQISRRKLSSGPPFENRKGWGSLGLGLCEKVGQPASRALGSAKGGPASGKPHFWIV
jgi:hypothetical protein